MRSTRPHGGSRRPPGGPLAVVLADADAPNFVRGDVRRFVSPYCVIHVITKRRRRRERARLRGEQRRRASVERDVDECGRERSRNRAAHERDRGAGGPEGAGTRRGPDQGSDGRLRLLGHVTNQWVGPARKSKCRRMDVRENLRRNPEESRSRLAFSVDRSSTAASNGHSSLRRLRTPRR